jgi:dethiobiotin synthetase
MKGIFVTGTDTGVGKTIVTGLLARFLADEGYRVITQKWVETGSCGFSRDVNFHLKLMGKTKRDIVRYLPDAAPFVFKFPASPHLAAFREGKKINPARIKNSYKSLNKDFDLVVVEGTGGVMVPLNRNKLVVDIAEELHLSALVVAGNKLGAINHTLLTIEALRARKMKIIGIIFNNQKSRVSNFILEDNPEIIKNLAQETVLGNLPRFADKKLLHKYFRGIGRKILSAFKQKGYGRVD